MIILIDNELINFNNCIRIIKVDHFKKEDYSIDFYTIDSQHSIKFRYNSEKERDQDFDDIIYGLKQGITFISL